MHNVHVSTTVIYASKKITVLSVFTDCCKYIQLNEVKLTSSCFSTSIAHTRTHARTLTHTKSDVSYRNQGNVVELVRDPCNTTSGMVVTFGLKVFRLLHLFNTSMKAL
jgi:hypothetical protein